MALDMLREFEPEDGYYLAYSGGKDSTVLLDLARRSGVRFDAHYNLTTVDPPELVYFIRAQPDVIVESPEETMWDLIVRKRFPPTRYARYCCEVFKERGGQDRWVLTGVRAAESARRSKRQQVESCMRGGIKRYFHPIFHWSDSEVWEYIHSRKLPYCKLYDEGFKRLGCICCPMKGGKGQLRDAERWPKYKAQYLRTFQKMLDKKIAGGFDVGDWRKGQDVWDWWVRPNPAKEDEAQMTIFE
jgi:phosphoadenosine phosphosulfate reductase